ncbi:MAG TPA: Hsp70 family protein [Sedimentisphaerales bacterium]|nr:Hsp70 family protein [Sedimentisphaerales bacterium]
MTKPVGIDLGTTFSALAVLNTIGKPEIVPNAEGERITPSAIYFDEENSQMIRVGIEALNSRCLAPERTVRWIKRHMGETSWRKRIDNREWTAVELSSLILKKLKQDASVLNGDIRDVVISVPAHFDESRRKATMDAGARAGLNVLAIVNEPVAAALHYATTRNISGRVLVYDLGGGTFDVTIMQVKNQQIDIICSQGDHQLGGIDFDRRILEMFEEAYRQKFGEELISSEEERAKYEDEAEDVKKTLSRRDSARKMLYGKAGSMKIDISRQMFEDAISSLIARTEMLLEVALDEAGLSPSEIDIVLLVGGSTRIPLVQERLTKMFGFAPEVGVNVDEAVALGAAVHAGLTMLRDRPQDVPAGIAAGLEEVKLRDVCNHSYGTLCARREKDADRQYVENYIILRKNTPLPCETTQMFYTVADDQRDLQVAITQGEDTCPDYVNTIAVEKFELPEGRKAGCPVKVTYSYDLNQRMHCKFEDIQSGRMIEVEFAIEDESRADEDCAVAGSGKVETFLVQ